LKLISATIILKKFIEKLFLTRIGGSTVAASVAGDISRVRQTATELAESGSAVENSAVDIGRITEYLKQLSTQFKLNPVHVSVATTNAGFPTSIPDLLRWDSSLQLGLSQIDDQHKQLVTMVNGLHRAMKQRQTLAVMGGILDRLISYTANHFGTEEKLFKQHRYPEYDAHKKIHEGLVSKVLDLKAKIERGDTTISMELMDFLKDWLANHIKITDKKYVPFLQAKGVR
jgi:methyl-accepting chemotaxis protein